MPYHAYRSGEKIEAETDKDVPHTASGGDIDSDI